MGFLIDDTLDINAPAEVVWQVLTDFELGQSVLRHTLFILDVRLLGFPLRGCCCRPR